MNLLELLRDADRKLDTGEITIGEYEKMIAPLKDAVPVVRCKDCKHNPKIEWFGCPMASLSEKQRPETAWCWKGERKDDDNG